MSVEPEKGPESSAGEDEVAMAVLVAVNFFMAFIVYNTPPAADSDFYWEFTTVWTLLLWAAGARVVMKAFAAGKLRKATLLNALLGGLSAYVCLQWVPRLFGVELADYPLIAHSYAISAFIFLVPVAGVVHWWFWEEEGEEQSALRRAVEMRYAATIVTINGIVWALL